VKERENGTTDTEAHGSRETVLGAEAMTGYYYTAESTTTQRIDRRLRVIIELIEPHKESQ
jgi:hypothetical protein